MAYHPAICRSTYRDVVSSLGLEVSLVCLLLKSNFEDHIPVSGPMQETIAMLPTARVDTSSRQAAW